MDAALKKINQFNINLKNKRCEPVTLESSEGDVFLKTFSIDLYKSTAVIN